MVGYFIDDNGKLVNSTYFDINLNKLKRYIETNEKDLEYFKYSRIKSKDKTSSHKTTPKNNVDKANKDDISSSDIRSDKDVSFHKAKFRKLKDGTTTSRTKKNSNEPTSKSGNT